MSKIVLIKMFLAIKQNLRFNLERFRSDQKGLAAIEFALFALILSSLFFGSFAAFDAMRAKRTLISSSAILIDLSTRIAQMNDSILADNFAASRIALGRYASSPHSFVITSIGNARGGGDELEVVWSESNGAQPGLRNSDIAGLDLPDIPDGTAVIVVQGALEYRSFVGSSFLPSVININELAIRNPRFVSEICYRRSSRAADCVD